jgi:cell wall-associated NlpC family hydrolase
MAGRRRVDPATGNTAPPILGPALDGSDHTRAVPATPASAAYTGDARWDHAVGPMQFLSATFQAWAVDTRGMGKADPNNAFDAIATAGRYLCNGAWQLDSIDAAVHRYNDSTTYVADVLTRAIAYGMATWGGSPADGGGGPSVGVLTGVDVAPVIGFALAQLGKPYVWGAAGPDSFDCSGLTQAAYATVGIAIGRTTFQQAVDGIAVDWRTQPVQAGDLVFTASGNGTRLGHVGLVLDATYWIVAPHAGAVVQITPIPFGAVQAVRRIVES